MNIRKWFARSRYTMERYAELLGELHAVQQLLWHNQQLLDETDHRTDWWNYAELKQIVCNLEADRAELENMVRDHRPEGWKV